MEEIEVSGGGEQGGLNVKAHVVLLINKTVVLC